MRKILVLSLILLSLPLTGQAQRPRDYFTIGIGPSIIYGDNTANFSNLDFKISPAISLGYNHQQSHHLDIRTTLGAQLLNSGNTLRQISPEEVPSVVEWGLAGQAKDFLGQAFFIDIMPVYNLRPVQSDMVGYPWLYHVGAGLGIIHVNRNEEILVATINFEGTDPEVLIQRRSTTAAYVPLRAGVSTNLEKDYDIGIEFSAFITTSSEIDGNNIRRKPIAADMLFQIQLIAKIYLGW